MAQQASARTKISTTGLFRPQAQIGGTIRSGKPSPLHLTRLHLGDQVGDSEGRIAVEDLGPWPRGTDGA